MKTKIITIALISTFLFASLFAFWKYSDTYLYNKVKTGETNQIMETILKAL